MDNELQIEEIRKFHNDLASQGRDIDENNAAFIWIEQNAESWRLNRRMTLQCQA